MSRIETVEKFGVTYVVRIHEPFDKMGIVQKLMKNKDDIDSLFLDAAFVCKVLSRTSPRKEDGKTGKPLGTEREFNAHFRGRPVTDATMLAVEVATLNGFFGEPSTSEEAPNPTDVSTEE